MSGQSQLIHIAVGGLVMQTVAGNWSVAGVAALPVDQNAAGSGTGHVEHRCSWWHLHDQIVGDLVRTDSILHLAAVISVVVHLQAAKHQLPRLGDLGIMDGSLVHKVVALEPLALRLAYRRAMKDSR